MHVFRLRNNSKVTPAVASFGTDGMRDLRVAGRLFRDVGVELMVMSACELG